jgi:uncharacterized protein DUF4259
MGAWGITNFANDTACDWIFSFEEEGTIDFIIKTIDKVFKGGYLDSDVTCEALAAIETVAAIRNKPGIDFPELDSTDLSVLAPSVNQSLQDTCKKAIDRILAATDNELYALWAGTDKLSDWINVQNDLSERISA